MSGPPVRRVAVVGAGITGTVLAMRLADRGHAVHLIERRPDPRIALADGDRSINLALSHRGLRALEAAGVAEPVRALAVAMRGRLIHDRSGDQTFQPYGVRPEHHLLSVSRLGLNQALVAGCADRPGIELSFGQEIVDVDLDATELTSTGAGGENHRRRYDSVFGADGAYSAIRQRMQRTSSFDFEQDFLDHGYKELTIPATPDGDHRIRAEALHIWPRGSHMLIALPNQDGSFTCTLFWPLDRQDELGFAGSATAEAFRADFPDAAALMPDLDRELAEHPVGTLVTTRSEPWHIDDRVLLIGDAAHAVVPFYGQGANAGLEDVTLLCEALDEAPDWATAFQTFARTRKPHADALAQLALDNYVEMRDHVASRSFRVRQQVERGLARVLPGLFEPLYTMVTFTSTPYADAVARARRQHRWITALLVASLVVIAALVVVVLVLVT